MRFSLPQRLRSVRTFYALALAACAALVVTFGFGLESARYGAARPADAARLGGWYEPNPVRATVILLHGAHGPRPMRGLEESALSENALGWYGGRD
jgi:hypothetical protein